MYLTFLALTLALVIAPGSTTAVVVRNTLSGGRRGGFAAAAGAAIGNTTHAVLAGVGLAVLVMQHPLVLRGLQLAGGLYLAGLAAGSLRRLSTRRAIPASDALLADGPAKAAPHAGREGVTTNLLNPSIAVFYLTVVPAFVPAGAPAILHAGFAATHVVLAFGVHSLWVIALDRLRHLVARPTGRLLLEATAGLALGALALKVLLEAVTSN